MTEPRDDPTLPDEPASGPGESRPEHPDHIGPFRILQVIGEGGMGVVYAAEQISLGRKVALKLMRSGFFAQGKAKERFRREIETISRLDHPGICNTEPGRGATPGTDDRCRLELRLQVFDELVGVASYVSNYRDSSS